MNLDQIMMDKNVQTAGIIVGVTFITGNILEFIYDRYRQKKYYSFHSLVANFSIALMQQLSDVFNKLIFFLGFIYVQQNFSIQKLLHLQEIKIDFPFAISSSFPFIDINFFMLFVWLFIIVIADFCQYWLHRLSHEVNIMWAGHIVHHSMEEYNYGVALRQSFIESVYTWIFYLPLAFFGIPWQLFIMAYTVSLIWQFFVHTRFINKLGVLEGIFSTPSHHRVHHGKNEQYIDKNYGAFLIIWDRIFGTFEPEVEAVDYGIKVPLQSDSPVWANVHHHFHIFKMMSKTKGIKNKLNILFGKPAFVPVDIESEYQLLKELQKPINKKPAVLKQFYIFINFLLTALSGYLLVNYYEETKNLVVFLPLAIFIACSFSINISLLENKKWADYAEVIKLISVIIAGIILARFTLNSTISTVAVGIAASMLLYTYIIARNDHQSINANV